MNALASGTYLITQRNDQTRMLLQLYLRSGLIIVWAVCETTLRELSLFYCRLNLSRKEESVMLLPSLRLEPELL